MHSIFSVHLPRLLRKLVNGANIHVTIVTTTLVSIHTVKRNISREKHLKTFETCYVQKSWIKNILEITSGMKQKIKIFLSSELLEEIEFKKTIHVVDT